MQNLAALARNKISNFDDLSSAPKNYRAGAVGWLISDEGVRKKFVKSLHEAKVNMTPEQEGSIQVKDGVISSPMMGLFKSWLGLPRTNYMTDQFEKALKSPLIQQGIANNWRELQNAKQRVANKGNDDEPDEPPAPAKPKVLAKAKEEPEAKPQVKVAEAKPKPTPKKVTPAAMDDRDDTPSARSKVVTLASTAAVLPAGVVKLPAVVPAVDAAESAIDTSVPAVVVTVPTPATTLTAAALNETAALPSSPPLVAEGAPLAVQAAQPTPPTARVEASVESQVLPPRIEVDPAALSEILTPLPAPVLTASTVTDAPAPPPTVFGASLEPIQHELSAVFAQIKGQRHGDGAKQVEKFLYGEAKDGYLNSKELYALVSKMQHATTDANMRETVKQLGVDLSALTTQSAKGSPADVPAKLVAPSEVVSAAQRR